MLLSRQWARLLYTASYGALILGIGLCLLVTGYDLVRQTLALAVGGAKYFYIFILMGAYAATVQQQPPPFPILFSYAYIYVFIGHLFRHYCPCTTAHREKGPFGHPQTIHPNQENRRSESLPPPPSPMSLH